MSTSTLDLITTYREVEKAISTPDRRVVLVGQAKYARPCPKCGKVIPKGETVINYGKVQDRWLWVCLNCIPTDPYETPHLKDLRCQDCGRLLPIDKLGEILCSSCAFWENGCATGRLVDCEEVTCCGWCRECGGSAECEDCAELEDSEVCCGTCESCPEWGTGGMAEYCTYCTIQRDMISAFDSDDIQQLRKAEEKVRQLEEELKRAKETYYFYANSLKQRHG
jgi:hypothetical protein